MTSPTPSEDVELREQIEARMGACNNCNGKWVIHHDSSKVICPHVEMLDDIMQLIKNYSLDQRIEDLENLQMYWFNYSVSVPRETTTPKPVKEHIRELLATLKAQRGEKQ